MGKSKDKKKKGKGMEKTIAKTEKKLEKTLKKELEEIGEDDIENLIAKCNEKDKELSKAIEICLAANKLPSRRGGATFSLLPEKDELILFGGDYFDNNKVYMFNDLFVYSIKKNLWTQIKAPNGPPPRTFHQAAVVSRNMAPNAPSARSGHRMVVFKKYLVVFGGYYDNLRNCRFYNDTYMFNIETNKWEETTFSAANDSPTPRSACQLSVCSKSNAIVLYGGFSKEKLKKDREKAIIHTDMYALSFQTKKGTDKVEWTWKKVKHSGLKPSDRISFSMITLHDDTSILFGGVFDQDEIADDDEDETNSNFFNDLYKLDLASYKWNSLILRGKSEKKKKKTKQVEAGSSTEAKSEDKMIVEEFYDAEEEEESEEEDEENLNLENLKLKSDVVSDAFTLSYSTTSSKEDNGAVVVVNEPPKNVFIPHARRSSYLQFHKGILYLYGGKYEDENEKEFTFNDMYTLNLKKLDEWKTLFEDKLTHAEIQKSKEKSNANEESYESYESDEENDKKKKDNENEDNDDDEDDDENDSDMEIDAPAVEPNETLDVYYARTNDLWLEEASNEFPDEKSKKILNKMAYELCKIFWESVKESK